MLNLMSVERFSYDLEMKTREQTERLRICQRLAFTFKGTDLSSLVDTRTV